MLKSEIAQGEDSKLLLKEDDAIADIVGYSIFLFSSTTFNDLIDA